MKFNVCFPLLNYIWIIILHHASCYHQLIETNKTKVESSSTYQDREAYASIDRNFSQHDLYCIHINIKKSEAWLQIDLGAIFNMKSVKIWYRGNIFRKNRPSTFGLNGFSILASRMSEIDKKDTCYQDAGNVSIDSVIEVNCTSVAKYVTIYIDKKNDPLDVLLKICVVEINGCPRFTYGEKCAPCGMCRNDCDIITGQCDKYGCREGYLPPFCKACKPGRYGEDCKEKCGFCENNMACHHINGSCPGSCEPGYHGEKCLKTCKPGRFGEDCKEKCGFCENNMACHHINGSCPGSCEPGYHGEKCLKTCKPGRYGEDCKENCGHCENNMTCHHINGSCPGSCEPGYHGEKCLTKCDNSWYCKECKERCGYCRGNRSCHHVNGSCSGFCEPGFHGDKCEGDVLCQILSNVKEVLKLMRGLTS